MKTRLTSRLVATTLVTALAGIGLTLPAAAVTGSAADPVRSETYDLAHDTSHSKALQAHVDAIMKTGTGRRRGPVDRPARLRVRHRLGGRQGHGRRRTPR
jgi:hypothetical protein